MDLVHNVVHTNFLYTDGNSERYPHMLVILTIILTGAVTLIIVITAALKFLHTKRLKLNCTEEPPCKLMHEFTKWDVDIEPENVTLSIM